MFQSKHHIKNISTPKILITSTYLSNSTKKLEKKRKNEKKKHSRNSWN